MLADNRQQVSVLRPSKGGRLNINIEVIQGQHTRSLPALLGQSFVYRAALLCSYEGWILV